MKKTLALLTAAAALLTVFASCGKNSPAADHTDTATPSAITDTAGTTTADAGASDTAPSDTDGNTDGTTAADSFEAVLANFRAPAEVVKIDLTAEDPSTDDIKFEFNEDGSLASCTVTINGIDYIIKYTEMDSTIQIFVFTKDGTVISNCAVEPKGTYNPSVGFAEESGYYFKGYQF